MDPEDHARLLAWDDVLDDANYYELLGVLEIADEDAIRQAFRQFSRAFHPDAHPGAEPEVEARLRRLFQRGAEAYRVLVDAERRAAYDLALAKGQTRLGVVVPGRTGVKSLDDLCRSASGKLHAREADKLISNGDLAGAKRRLLQAIRCETNPDPELDVR
ncbi:MAG TPA: DnaJ domain-containing protein, partial [Polyangiaceae bacterium]